MIPLGFARHFQAWMDRWVRKEDQQATFEKVSALLMREPGLIDEGFTWSRIVEMANASGS